MQKAFNKVARWIYKQKKTQIESADMAEKPIAALTDSINNVLQDGISKGLTHTIPDVMRRNLAENVYIFSGAKTNVELKELSRLLSNPDGTVKPFNKFWQETQGIHSEYNKNYLEAEYIYATQSAQMASKWNDIEQDGDRYNLQYRTANDDRVRDTHVPLHDITLPPSDPFWNEYYPPNGWRCRCTAVQVRKSKYPESNSEQAQSSGAAATDGKNNIFRFNAGKQQVIFPEHHPYLKQLNNQELNVISKNALQQVPEKVSEKKFKSGGLLQTPENFKQNGQEQKKNIVAYTFLAKMHGEHYKLLNVKNKHGVKNPDALNLKTKKYSDAKIPVSESGKNAIQNSIKQAASQQVSEVYIYLDKEYRMQDIWAGLKASLQKGRAKSIEGIIIRLKNDELKRYDAKKLRGLFEKKGTSPK